jgi:DNA-directed RNA polymerase subunit F
MKTLVLSVLFAWGVVAIAAETKEVALRPADREPSVEEIQMIRKILELPPERLSRIRGALEKLEHMSPEARKDFAANLAKFETASPEERRKLVKELRERGGNGARAIEHHLKSLSPEAAKAERARITSLTPEQRQEFVRGLIEKYGSELAKEKGKKMEDGQPGKKGRKPEGDVPPPPPAAKQ